MDMTAFEGDFELLDEQIENPSDEDGDDGKDQNQDTDNKSADSQEDDSEEKEGVGKDKDNSGDDDSSDDKGSSSQNIYSSLASALAEEGVISTLDNVEKVKSVEDLFNIIKEEIKKNELADLNEEQREYLKAVRSGVAPQVHSDYTSTLKQLDTISDKELEDNVDLRKSLIVQDLINQGMNPEKADKIAQRSIDLNEDLEESKEALKSIKVKAKEEYDNILKAQQQKILDAKAKEEQDLKVLKDTLYKEQEIIPGIKINENVKQKVYEQMTKIVGKSKTGQPLNALTKAREDDPVSFTIKMHYLFNATDGFKNFDKILKSQKSKAVQDLEATLRKTTFVGSGNALGDPKALEINEDLQNIIDNF